ncbi:MAG TPA: type II secretion system protein GspE, partial [Syntrophus sp. (in: bacteria)]|nr:type II secretion system protein GspE [Syntrophus sp. (in: bacteria)]
MKKTTAVTLEQRLSLAGVTPEMLSELMVLYRKGTDSLVDLLVQKKLMRESEVLQVLSEQLSIPFWPALPTDDISLDFTGHFPIQYLKKNRLVPLETAEKLIIAVNDPFDFQAIDDMRHELSRNGRASTVVLSTQEAITDAINIAYDLSRSTAKEFFEEMDTESTDSIISEIEETGDILDEAGDAPIIKLVNLLISGALKDRASDIHVEPYQSALKVRYRIDGVLYDVLSLPRKIQSPLTSRVKIMARLNIAEKRLPQDGRIEIRIADRSVDVRVSVLPTIYGERVVLRLLDKTVNILQLVDLGMSTQSISFFDRLIKSPYGIILVTGPTGSGKTTTLY